MQVTGLWRYPVKGLRGERLARVTVAPGRVFPLDRRFALAHGDSGITPENPKWALKTEFHMLMHGPDAGLAALTPSYDESSGVLTIDRDGETLAQSKVGETAGQAAMNAFFADYLGAADNGGLCFVESKDAYFGNIEAQVISLINLASVRDFSKTVGTAVSERRFRGNIYIDGLEPWAERAWVGKTLRAGDVSFAVVDETIRCGATVVNPETHERDLNVPKLLENNYGHMFCGVYLKAEQAGTLSEGLDLTIAG